MHKKMSLQNCDPIQTYKTHTDTHMNYLILSI